MRTEEANKATFSHWPKLETLFATQAWILLRHLPEANTSEKAVLRVRCLRSVSFIGSKGAFVSSLSTTERFHLGRFLVEGHLFRSWYRYMKKSEICFTVGEEKSTEYSLHHLSNRAHFD